MFSELVDTLLQSLLLGNNISEKRLAVFPGCFLQIFCSHLRVGLSIRIVWLTSCIAKDTLLISLLLLSLSLGCIIIGTLCVLSIQLCTNRSIERILSPGIKFVLTQGDIILAIRKHNLAILAISGKGHLHRFVTCFHGHLYGVARLQPTAIILGKELLISSIHLLSKLLIDIIIHRNRCTHFLDVGTRNLLDGRLPLLVRHNYETSTIFIGFLQEHLLTSSKRSWHDVSVFCLIWPKLFLQRLAIAIISMLQSIINTILGILSLHILTHGILLRWSHIARTLSQKLLHVLAILVCLHHNIHLCLIISKGTLQSSLRNIIIMVDCLQTLCIPILIGILSHHIGIRLAFIGRCFTLNRKRWWLSRWNLSRRVCKVCSRVCTTRSWYGVGTVLVRSGSL